MTRWLNLQSHSRHNRRCVTNGHAGQLRVFLIHARRAVNLARQTGTEADWLRAEDALGRIYDLDVICPRPLFEMVERIGCKIPTFTGHQGEPT